MNAYFPALFLAIFVEGEFILHPFINLSQRHAVQFAATDGHLDEVHVRIRRSLVTIQLITLL